MKTSPTTAAALAAVSSIVLALATPAPALANQCVYSDGNNNNGPCVEVRNETGWSQTMNLWCHNGPTPRSQKIILRGNPDSFTCRGVSGAGTKITIQRTQIGCNYCDLTYACEGKLVVSLLKNYSGTEWLDQGDCATVD